MLISNKKLNKTLRWTLLVLAALSIADLVVARISHPISELFWGYLFGVFVISAAMLYWLLGKPYFKLSVENDLLNFKTGIITNKWLADNVQINKQNLVDFKIKRRLFKKILVVSVLSPNGIIKKHIGISYLSNQKIEQLENTLKELLQEEENEHLFI